MVMKKLFLRFGVLVAVAVAMVVAVGCDDEKEKEKEDVKDLSVAYGAYAGKMKIEYQEEGKDPEAEEVSWEVTVEEGAKKGELIVKEKDGGKIHLVEGLRVSNGVLFNIDRNEFSEASEEKDDDGVVTKITMKADDGLKEYYLEVDGKKTDMYSGSYMQANKELAFGFNISVEIKVGEAAPVKVKGTVRISLKKK